MEWVELRPLKSIRIWNKSHYMERKRPDFVSEDSWGSRGREFKSRHSDQTVENQVFSTVFFYPEEENGTLDFGDKKSELGVLKNG